jgi:hypothetical protein
MKAKQLPNGLDHWLKTRTVVIGGVTSLQANLNRPAPRSQRKQKEIGAVVIRKHCSYPFRIKLVPRFKFEARGLGC